MSTWLMILISVSISTILLLVFHLINLLFNYLIDLYISRKDD